MFCPAGHPDGTKSLDKYEITFDWEKIKNRSGTFVTDTINVEKELADWKDEINKELGINFKSYMHSVNAEKPTYSGIIAHEWGHVFTGLSTFKDLNPITKSEVLFVKGNETFAREFERARLFVK